MPDTLCIAELKDGRRALCYIDPDAGKAEIVLVLRSEDLQPNPWGARREAEAIAQALRERRLPPHVADAQPLPIPDPPKRRLSAADLLAMRPAEPPTPTREEQILRDLDRLQRGDTKA